MEEDIKKIVYLIVIVLAVLKIAFYRENLLTLLRIDLALFWLFVIPGYMIMLGWAERMDFVERIIAGAGISSALTGILSCYFGLAGVHIKWHIYFLPPLLMLIGFWFYKKKRGQK